MMRIVLTICAASLSLFMCTCSADADVVTKDIEYSDGEVKLRGYLAYDDTLTEPAPGVLICHQWMGLTDHEKNTARRLAGGGFVAFALDVYGVESRPADRKAAGQAAGKFKNDPQLLRKRATLGLEQLRGFTWTDKSRIAAIGFCFGGTTALELARSGADIAGVVSLHGGLGTANPSDANNIKCRVLVLHGGDDPHVPITEVNGFIKEMQDAEVDWQMISYGGAVHSFTQRDAGNDKSTGSAYDEDAARRSWQHMMFFFDEIFQLKPAPTTAPNAWTEKN